MASTRPILLDGGMGRELRFRGVEIPDTIWSANALLVAQDVVREVHRDYILAGAEVITTNSYGVVREDLAKDGIEDRAAELNRVAGQLAVDGRELAGPAGKNVRIAGSLPPLRGSYRPDLVAPLEEIYPEYLEQVEALASYVDLFIAETMSSGAEGYAAALAAATTGKPVWVSYTLHEDRSGRLRSEETVTEAIAALKGVQVEGILANCSAPESITAAIPELVASGATVVGGYANTFVPVPIDWTLDGGLISDGLIGLRPDLGPEEYAEHVTQWLRLGANAIGGCCGTRPAHIARLRELLTE